MIEIEQWAIANLEYFLQLFLLFGDTIQDLTINNYIMLSFFHCQIVSKDLSDPVRSHKDLDKDAAPYFKKAVNFYDELAKQLVNQGHVLDVFASALDQV